MNGSVIVCIHISISAGIVNRVNRNGQHVVRTVGNNGKLSGGTGWERIAVLHGGLYLKESGGIVDHAADLINGALIIGTILIYADRIAYMQLGYHLLRNRKGDGLTASAGNHGQKHLGSHVIVHLNVAGLHLAGNRCSHVCKLHLIIIVQLCGIIGDLGILGLSLSLLKCHTCDITCREQRLLTSQIGIGVIHSLLRGFHLESCCLYLLGIDLADWLSLLYHITCFYEHIGDLTGCLRINVNHIRRLYLAHQAAVQFNTSHLRVLYIHHRNKVFLLHRLFAHCADAGRNRNHRYDHSCNYHFLFHSCLLLFSTFYDRDSFILITKSGLHA